MSAQYTKYHIRYTSAYTLIEILVALTIIGIIFGLGYVGFRDFSRRQSIAGAGKLLLGDLRLAQQQALSGLKPADPKCNSPEVLDGFDFNVVNSSRYTLDAVCSGGVVATKAVDLASDLTLSIAPVNPIIFKSLGQGTNLPNATNSVITIKQTGTNNTFSVTVSAGGEIQ